MGSDNAIVIKTTAKLHEASEPSRQRPIIRIDGAPPTIYQDFDDLPNTIRASIDSGRDNPFRPDGKIYKSADPIVDYYKFGPNQSRTNTPTAAESQLLLNGHRLSPTGNDSKSFLAGNWLRRKRKTDKKSSDKDKELQIEQNDKNIDSDDGRGKKSCWRRWCCCFCSSRCCKKDEQKSKDTRTDHKISRGQKINAKIALTNDGQQVENKQRANDLALEIADSKRQLDQPNHHDGSELNLSGAIATTTKPKQLRTAVVIDHYNSQITVKNGTSAVINTTSTLKPTNGHHEPELNLGTPIKRGGDRQDNGPTGPTPTPSIHTTQVETTKSKKCIIS